jgi:WD40 repeat protein
LWQDATTGRVERKQNLEGGASAVSFAPDGRLATGSWPGVVQLWNPRTGAQIGHETLVAAAPVASVSFAPDGDRFATTGGSDGLAKIWEAKTRQQFGATFPGDPGAWGNAAYTPDGSRLIVIYAGGKGFVWPTSIDELERHACAVAGRNFTREEWSRYVSGRPYSKVCP